MNEIKLHELWKNKDIPINLKLTDGRALNVINFGHYNESLAGPDFSMGIIHLDGIDQVGPIELHMKSSDWYKHKHHLDENYNNVVLHVVYEHDKDVLQGNRLLPTLQLKDYLVHNKLKNTSVKSALPCSSSVANIPESVIERMKNRAIVEKLQNKLSRLSIPEETYTRKTLYVLLSDSFGFGVNTIQFMSLAEKVPVESLIDMSEIDRVKRIMEASDVEIEKSKVDLNKHIVWNKKGLRPNGFPVVRVKQFSFITAYLLFSDSFLNNVLNFETKHIKSQLVDLSNRFDLSISKGAINHIVINCIVPFQAVESGLKESVVQFRINRELKAMASEKNKFSRKMSKEGFHIASAFDSQALTAQYKNSCSRKKCLSCELGKWMLNLQDKYDSKNDIFL